MTHESCVKARIVIPLKSEIEKNLKFTIEQNIVEINRLKALVDEANNKQKQEQFARQSPAGSFGISHYRIFMFASMPFICHVMKCSYSDVQLQYYKS